MTAPERPDDGHADEGAAYARALLRRIARGQSSPEDLDNLLQFLQSGAMLRGACIVIFAALAAAVPSGCMR